MSSASAVCFSPTARQFSDQSNSDLNKQYLASCLQSHVPSAVDAFFSCVKGLLELAVQDMAGSHGDMIGSRRGAAAAHDGQERENQVVNETTAATPSGNS